MFLLDTNIILEIFLEQEKSIQCENFLNANIGKLAITDFTLHSIGIILFRHERQRLFNAFISEMLDKINILSMPAEEFISISSYSDETGLDFDDTYQCLVAKTFDLTIITMDNDFKKAIDVKVKFL
jgi:uncharacterized protein